ncbi:Hsp70 family chaperone LHS1 NDAI_0C00420 [Naumovozyma dairenensis CBS 421]|uniref:Uncharacterized protein n=1 Tax=Naumovozyma dairenensis (strain ATCC 10597 / BCRC 20456 / CBS 421 / NBRC 0211 / NRRL Y-12639) TaxID=1071378 RepID=G0W7E2_NAUDC|nr:hypothetical protein NDAI_0C00420 [Naumovozyma dairenensis CBS 421]CCD23703.1 hypothetical protein NDAI_0C00420 [Naumovozyma dairenensis CBS 421]
MKLLSRQCSLLSITLMLVTLVTTISAAVIGIDYGQQNIKAMVISPQAPLEIVLTPEAKRKDISGLAIKKLPDGIERIYGSAVGSLATRFPQNTLLNLKPLLGKSIANEPTVLNYLKEHPGVNITATSTGRNSLSFVVDGVEYPLEEIVAMNLEEIVDRANVLLKEKDARTNDNVDMMAITVPGYFYQAQRNALLDVSSLVSGISKTSLINDGLSIAINFAIKKRDFELDKAEYYIVYDMGSGSTKATLVSILKSSNESEPLRIELGGYGYRSHLGGSTFTLEVATLIENNFLAQHPKIRTETLHANPKAIAKINQAAEKAKLILSANTEAFVSIESLIDDIDFKTTVTRQELEDISEDHLAEIIEPIQEALDNQLWDNNVTMKNLSGVILHGGSTRVPLVQRQLIDFVGEDNILRNVNADESAVNGVVLRGVQQFDAFKTRPLDIIERSISDYSIKVSSSSSQATNKIFPKGSIFPATITMELHSINDTTMAPFSIDLYENGKILSNVTVDVSNAEDSFSNNKCKHGVSYNGTFSLSSDRVFKLEKVEAICLNSLSKTDEEETDGGIMNKLFKHKPKNETAAETTKKPKYNKTIKLITTSTDINVKPLSPSEKYNIIRNIKDLGEFDRQRFQLQESKNLLESSLYSARNFLEEDDVIKNGPKAQVDKLSQLVSGTLEWLEEDSDHATKKQIDKKLGEINSLKDRVELYIKTSKEPLDSNQFSDILDKAALVYKDVSDQQKMLELNLKALEKKISSSLLNVTDEFYKIRLPISMNRTLANIETLFSKFNKTVAAIEDLVDLDSFEEMGREQLYELKLKFDNVHPKIQEKLAALRTSYEYRFNELNSLHQRKLRAQKRKEEKAKRQLEKKLANATETIQGESSSTLTSTETAKVTKESTTTILSTDMTSKTTTVKSSSDSSSSSSSLSPSPASPNLSYKTKRKPGKKANGKKSRSSKSSSSSTIMHDEL